MKTKKIKGRNRIGALKRGVKVESEHKDLYNKIVKELNKQGIEFPMTQKEFFKEIAEAHIKEKPNYYDLLEKYVERYSKDGIKYGVPKGASMAEGGGVGNHISLKDLNNKNYYLGYYIVNHYEYGDEWTGSKEYFIAYSKNPDQKYIKDTIVKIYNNGNDNYFMAKNEWDYIQYPSEKTRYRLPASMRQTQWDEDSFHFIDFAEFQDRRERNKKYNLDGTYYLPDWVTKYAYYDLENNKRSAIKISEDLNLKFQAKVNEININGWKFKVGDYVKLWVAYIDGSGFFFAPSKNINDFFKNKPDKLQFEAEYYAKRWNFVDEYSGKIIQIRNPERADGNNPLIWQVDIKVSSDARRAKNPGILSGEISYLLNKELNPHNYFGGSMARGGGVKEGFIRLNIKYVDGKPKGIWTPRSVDTYTGRKWWDDEKTIEIPIEDYEKGKINIGNVKWYVDKYEVFASGGSMAKGGEVKIGNTSYHKDKKVGDTLDIRQDSSSPPAVWTETYKITRIESNGDIYGIYQSTPQFREFEGWEMMQRGGFSDEQRAKFRKVADILRKQFEREKEERMMDTAKVGDKVFVVFKDNKIGKIKEINGDDFLIKYPDGGSEVLKKSQLAHFDNFYATGGSMASGGVTMPRFGYEMYTKAGDNAVHGLINRIARKINGQKRITKEEILAFISEGMKKIAEKHGEVYDTEPEYHIQAKTNELLRSAGYGFEVSRYDFAKGGRAGRPSPSESATKFPKGYQKIGNDGNWWEIRADKRGVQSWKKIQAWQVKRAKPIAPPPPPAPDMEFNFSKKNKYAQEFMDELSKRGIKTVRIPFDNGIEIELAGDTILVFDNAGEFKIDNLTNNKYLGVVYFKENGKERDVSDIMDELTKMAEASVETRPAEIELPVAEPMEPVEETAAPELTVSQRRLHEIGMINENLSLTNMGRRVVDLHKFCFPLKSHPMAHTYPKIQALYPKFEVVDIDDVMMYTGTEEFFEVGTRLSEDSKRNASANMELQEQISLTKSDGAEYKPYSYCPALADPNGGFVVFANYVNTNELYVSSSLYNYAIMNYDVRLWKADSEDAVLLYGYEYGGKDLKVVIRVRKQVVGLEDSFGLYDRDDILGKIASEHPELFYQGRMSDAAIEVGKAEEPEKQTQPKDSSSQVEMTPQRKAAIDGLRLMMEMAESDEERRGYMEELGRLTGRMDEGGSVAPEDAGREHVVAASGKGDVWIVLAKTEDGLLLSERFDHPITNELAYSMYKDRGYEVVDGRVFRVKNKGVLDAFKDAVEDLVRERHGEEVDWDDTILSYSVNGDMITVARSLVRTSNGKEYEITPDDLVSSKHKNKTI